jgi:hypothetical protein
MAGGPIPCQFCGNYFCGMRPDGIAIEKCEGYYRDKMSLRDKTIKMEPLPETLAYEAGKKATFHELEMFLTAYLGDDFFARKFSDCIDLIRKKNSDYTQGQGARDRIAHFREAAKDLDLPMLKIWQVFVRKHWATIQKFANGGTLESEPIGGRIDDVINYMVLLAAIIEDGKTGEE